MKYIKPLLILIYFLLNSDFVYSQTQGINNNWIMGYSSWGGSPFGNPRINFYSGLPVISLDSLAMEFRHTHSNISDSLGNLLFYTNGAYIADASNDTMIGGSGINPGAYANFASDGFGIANGALILKKPDSAHLYYIFHGSCDDYPNGCIAFKLLYSIVDMSLNGGLGQIISKNVPIIIDSLNSGKIVATKHSNGRDYWIMVHRTNSNEFYTMLFTPSGISGPYSQHIGIVRNQDAGQAWFSPDGKRYAYFYINGGLEVFDFDRCSGLLSNPTHINLTYENGYNVGMAVSPNSNVLYVSNVFHIYQFDLTSTNIAASMDTVATYDGFLSTYPGWPGFSTLFGLCALAPDGKIYITTGNGTLHMHTIDNPDVLGVGCNVNQHSVQLPAYYFNTLPNHPNYFLGCDTTSSCTCLTGENELSGNGVVSINAAPNPSDGIFTLKFPVNQQAGSLEVYDVLGNLVYEEYVAAWSQFKKVDISHFSPGIYFCRLRWKDREGSVKVINE